MAKAFKPRFKGSFRVIKQKGNQVEIRLTEGGETTKVHITDVKKVTLLNILQLNYQIITNWDA